MRTVNLQAAEEALAASLLPRREQARRLRVAHLARIRRVHGHDRDADEDAGHIVGTSADSRSPSARRVRSAVRGRCG